MPRVVSTTWFEDIGFINQPILDFKLARLSIRQAVHLFLWAGIAYLFYGSVAELFFSSPMLKAGLSLAILVTGMALFARRGKVFAPEWYLYYFVWKYVSGLRPGEEKGAGEEVVETGKPETGPTYMVAPMGEPTRIAGVLYGPSTGERLSEVEYEVRVDGDSYYSGKTDNDGEYSFIFTPSDPGRHVVEVVPGGYSKPVERVEVEGRKVSAPSVSSGEAERAVDQEGLKTEETARGVTSEEPEDKYVYELFPTNFVNLPPEEQNSLVDSFRGLLNSLDSEVKIVVQRSSKEVDMGDRSVEPEFFKYYIISEDPVDANLRGAGFLYQRTTDSPEPEVVRTFRDFVAVKGGRNQKTGTVYKMSERLIEGFPAELYSAADRIAINVEPMNQGDAVDKMERFMHMKGAISRGGGGREETSEAERAREALRKLSEGGSRLFKARINVTAGGETEEAMEDNYEQLESNCRGRMVSIHDPKFVQDELLRGSLGKELYLDTVTLGAFFPFVSADVMESHGVFLGVNQNTGAPVIYDPFIRPNAHMALIGVTGGGKSFAAKTYLTRLFEKNPDMAYFVVDPENEYTRATTALDPETEVRHISRDRKLGLDPLKLFRSKDVALSMLTDALDLGSDEPDLLSRLRVRVQNSSSLEALLEGLDERKKEDKKLHKRLEGLLEGPEGFLFKGEARDIPERTVFNLKDLHQSLKVSDERVGTLHIASLLVFGQIWQKIEELPKEKPKVVIVDEVWLYTAVPAAASFLEYVSRRGRRRNVLFVLASQRPADVLESESGRATIENCATKVILQQDKAATDLVADAFDLTESEIKASLEFDPGQAILTADKVKAPLKFFATPRERQRFSTKPGGETG